MSGERPASTRPDVVLRRRQNETQPLKLVVTGPFSAGKTTLIRTISEGDFLDTDKEVTDGSRSIKPQTTVAMDFGRLDFSGGLSLQLVGTPGQQRFDVMWEILAQGMLGFVLLVDPGAPDALEESSNIMETFLSYRKVPFVVAVSHLDTRGEEAPGDLRMIGRGLKLPPRVPVLSCDPRRKEDVKRVLLSLLTEVMRASTSARVATG
jgi:signal recognition particle receptor subunit beta